MVFGPVAGSSSDRLPSILIVDGDDDTRDLYRTILAPVAQSILEADNGVAALQAVMRARPDLIITETHLRTLDGFSLCERLRDDPLTCQTLRLVVTGAARAVDLERASQSGADRLLIKPCTPEALRATVVAMWRERSPQLREEL
jgi:CheY-like chemotaxis protein